MNMKKNTAWQVFAVAFALILLMPMASAFIGPVTVEGTVTYANGTSVPAGWNVSMVNVDEDYPGYEPWMGTTGFYPPCWNYTVVGTAENLSTFVITVTDLAGVYTGSGTFTAASFGEVIVNITMPDMVLPSVTNPTATPSSIPADGTNTSQLNVTVTDDTGIESVTIDLSTIRGSSAQIMDNIGNNVYSCTTTAGIGTTSGVHNLQVTATDTSSNANTNTSVYIPLNVTTPPDTTAPDITNLNPPDGSSTTDTTPTISASYSDLDSGINTSSVILTLDGADVTATVTVSGVTYTPTTPLSYGMHTVKLNVSNTAGLPVTKPWSFVVTRPPSGGGKPTVTVKAGETSVSTEATGEVKTSVTATSTDAKAAATISAGTIAKDAAGKALTTVTVAPPTTLPDVPPAGAAYVGYAYDFGPEGATFDPAIEIAIEFDPTKFDKTPVIYVYEADKWVRLDTTVVDNKAIAKVTHFSTFVLFDAEEVEVTPTAEPTAEPTAVPTAAPTEVPPEEPTEEPTAKLPWGLIIGIIIAVIIVGAAAYYFYTKKKA